MNRLDTFTFRINDEERSLLTALADRLQRNQSDALRWLVRNTAQELGIIDIKYEANNQATEDVTNEDIV